MSQRWLSISIFSVVLLAADKKLPIEETSNDLIDVSANAFLDKDQIQKELGADPGDDIVLVKVTVRPVSDKPIKVSLDDFLLVSGKDGQRAEPYTPSQIAGSDTLVVTRQQTKKKTGLSLGLGGIGVGGGSGDGDVKTDTKAEKADADKPNPLLAILKDKVLPEKEITDSISGFLYFQMVGKVKPKDLELHYKGPAGKLALRFHP
jgi:hypothetical protein